MPALLDDFHHVYWQLVVRHEALKNRAEVEGLRRWLVAAG